MIAPYYDCDGITIYHGDCREVVPALGAFDLLLTDPPFGIGLKEHGRNGHNWSIVGDHDQSVGIEMLSRFESSPAIVFASPKKPWPGQWRQFLVWDKGPAVGGGGDRATCWKFDWELIQIRKIPSLNGKRDSSVLRYWIGQSDYALHPNQKPTDLLRYLVWKATIDGDLVVDPFMGSGSTCLAAKLEGRRAIGIEVEEKYCEIAANRLQQEVLF